MAPDPAVVVSSDGGSSEASRRCLVPPDPYRTKCGVGLMTNLGSRAHL
jgi:hypothetical protein